MPMLDHLWIILALPLAGAAINGLLGKNWPKSAVNSVAIGSVSLAFLAVVETVREFLQLPANQIPWVRTYFPWMSAGIGNDEVLAGEERKAPQHQDLIDKRIGHAPERALHLPLARQVSIQEIRE